MLRKFSETQVIISDPIKKKPKNLSPICLFMQSLTHYFSGETGKLCWDNDEVQLRTVAQQLTEIICPLGRGKKLLSWGLIMFKTLCFVSIVIKVTEKKGQSQK